MNENLPKPMLDALARKAKPPEHPSADLLAAFAEYALTDRERGSVADHLAHCAECREAVFLASGAAEEVTEHSEELVVASRGVQPRPVTAYAAAPIPRAEMVEKPRRRWLASRWVWAASGAAVFVLVGGLFVSQLRFKASPMGREFAIKSAPSLGNRYPQQAEPVKPDQVENPQAAPQARKPKVRPAPQVPVVPQKPEIAHESTADILAVVNQPPAPKPAKEQRMSLSSAKPAADSTTITIGSAKASAAPAAPPTASGFAPNAGQAQQQIDALNVTVSRALSSATHPHSAWRISPQGQLEHLTSGGWTRMLADQPSGFRVVSVIGNNVWAGGNDAMLFHSGDNGLHWNKVALPAAAQTGSIVSIRFSDVRNGEIVTDSGASFTTADAGTTWTQQ